MRIPSFAAIIVLAGSLALAQEPQPTLVDDTQYLPVGPIGVPDEVPVPEDLPKSSPVDELYIAVYVTADLIIEAEAPTGHAKTDMTEAFRSESSPVPTIARSAPATSKQRRMENLSELVVLIQSTVSPESWDAAGGSGHITIHNQTSSLVIRQTAAVHDEIADLLTQLRRAMDIEVSISIEQFTPPGIPFPKDGSAAEQPKIDFASISKLLARHDRPLSPAAADALRAELKQAGLETSEHRLSLGNGETRLIRNLSITPTISGDQRSLRMFLQIRESDAPAIRCRIADGASLLLPYHQNSGAGCALLTATIIIPEEEEEILNDAPTPAETFIGVGLNSGASLRGCITITDELVGPAGLLPIPPTALGLISSEDGPLGIQVLQLLGHYGEAGVAVHEIHGAELQSASPPVIHVAPANWDDLKRLRTEQRKTEKTASQPAPRVVR